MREDLKAAIRSLRTSRTYTVVALTVLALSIGAGTAIFSVVDAVVLRGLPYDEHDRIVAVLEHDPARPTTFGEGRTTPQTYLDWRSIQRSFEGLAAVSGYAYRIRNERGEPAQAFAQRVTHEFFRTLRVSPQVGRSFTAKDEIYGRHRVVILSYGLWQRRFGGAADVLGRTMDLNEEPWQIVGVMPRGFSYPVGSQRPTEVYAPLAFRDDERTRGNTRNFNLTVIGRLKDGTTIEQAQQRMNAVSAALDTQHPKWNTGRRTRVVTLHEHLVGRTRSWMLMLLGAVALVMLIACANVANLMIARATVRGREMGIRVALGASRWSLARALLVEAVVLSLLGAAIGVVLAYGGVGVLRAWLPRNIPRVAAIAIDLRVLAAAVSAAVLTGLAFGAIPALQGSRPDVNTVLNDGGRTASPGTRARRVRNALVIAELALAVVLLVCAGLFIGSFAKLMRVDPGFDYRNVLTLDVFVRFEPGQMRQARERGRPYVDQMLQAVSQVPGVEMAAALEGGLPLSGSWSRTGVELPGKPEFTGDDEIDLQGVSGNYLALLRVPLVRGRPLDDRDGPNAPAVALVNEAAARKYWRGQDPVGQHVKFGGEDRIVVGMVGDLRQGGPETVPRQEAYIPFAQAPRIGATLVMKTRGNPLDVLPAVRRAIWSVNPEQRLNEETVTMEAYMDQLVAQRRFNMALLGLFGVLGLVIAAVGIYGVMSYVVAQRTHEIGVRIAIGATPARVMSMIVGQASLLMLAGLAIGVVGASYLSAATRAFLFHLEPNDPRVLAAAVVTLMAAGLAASAVPARRAAAVDPIVALRRE
jgi:putative ABC transport system permease protein